MTTNRLDPFEKGLRDSLETHEADYNHQDWLDLEQALDQQVPVAGPSKGSQFFRKPMFFAITGAVLLTGGIIGIQQRNALEDGPEPVVEKEIKIAENQDKLPDATTAVASLTPEKKSQSNVAPLVSDKEESVSDVNKEEKSALPVDKTTENIEPKNSFSADDNITEEKDPVVKGPDPKENKDPKPATNTPEISDPGSGLTEVLRIVSDQQDICPGSALHFETLEEVNGKHLWNFGDGSSSKIGAPTHIYTESGKYQVVLLELDENDEVIRQSESLTINVLEAPKPTFSWKTSQNPAIDPNIFFEIDSEEYTKARWNFGDNTASDKANPVHVFKYRNVYPVTLEVEYSNGCVRQVTEEVRVEEGFNLLAPNSFSPGNDQTNDYWLPEALKYGDKQFTLNVMDKAGNLVFTTNDKNRQWDGRIGGSRVAHAGEVFVWYAIVKDEYGNTNEYYGSITIVNSRQ